MKLSKETVLVIGGSSGIGRAICSEAHREGASVVLVGRSREKLEAAAHDYAVSDRVRTIAADMSNEAEARAVFAELPRLHHVVVTTVNPYYQPIRELELARARRLFESKLDVSLLAAKHASFAENASLVLTSGVAADRPGTGGSVVAAVNGAIEALVRALCLELAPVRVNAISPGWVDTPVWDAFAAETKAARFEAQAKKLPTGRIGAPVEIATAAVFLMTNGFTTGETLHVDGGHRLV